MPHPLLKLKDLHVNFDTYAGTVQAVRGVSFHIGHGEVVGLVGESGCGKSVTAHSILRLINTPPAKIDSGEIWFEEQNLLKKSERQMRDLRGNKIGIIFQDPMTSLNPTMRVGKQLVEGILRHKPVSTSEAKQLAIEMLGTVGIPDAAERFHQYPHEFSGGMRQRVMIAIALACDPTLLIADEPTTALDVTIQAQILELIKRLKRERGMSVLLITHDLGVVAGLCDRIIVMYAGEIMEVGSVEEIFYRPQHPYTKALLAAVPRLGRSYRQNLEPIYGAPPNLLHPPVGCPFADRCQWAMEICQLQPPPLKKYGDDHMGACWLHHPQASDRLREFHNEEMVLSHV